MRKITLFSVVGFLLTACAEGEFSENNAVVPEQRMARIVLVEEHPFDIEAALTHPSGVYLPNLLRFLHARDTDQINTDYDEMKSLVTIIRGPLSPGTRVEMQFNRRADDRAEYTVENVVDEAREAHPAITVNAYRINRPAKVRVQARINGRLIAEKRFEAVGPKDEFEKEWAMKPGDTKLTTRQLKDTLIGKRFRIDVGGTGYFASDGSYTRSRPNETKVGTYDVREDGFLCTDFQGDPERCYIFVYDNSGNLVNINQASIRYRIEVEA